MKRLLFVVLIAVLLTSVIRSEADFSDSASFGEFSGTETVNARLTAETGNWPFFSRLYYLPSSLPEGYDAAEVYEMISLDDPDGNRTGVKPSACSIEYVSGIKSISNAIAIKHDDISNETSLIIDSEKLTETGSAIFRLRAEGEGLYYQNEFTLTVISWEKYPLFEPADPMMHASACIGEGDTTEEDHEMIRLYNDNTYLYTAENLISMLLKDHTEEVAQKCLNKEQREGASETGIRTMELYDMSLAGQYSDEEIWTGRFTAVPFRYEYFDGYQFRKSGEYKFRITPRHSNIILPPAVFSALPYNIQGPSFLLTGEQETFTVKDSDPDSGRTFFLRIKGENNLSDHEKEILRVDADAPAGTVYTIIATPSDGQPEVSMNCTVTDGLLYSEDIDSETISSPDQPSHGFKVPVLKGPKAFRIWQTVTKENGDINSYGSTDDEKAPYILELEYRISKQNVFAEQAEVAGQIYQKSLLYDNSTDIQEETIILDEHPARIYVMTVNGTDGYYSCGEIQYIRNDRMLVIHLFCTPQNGTRFKDMPKITKADMRKLADHITYNPAEAQITMADGNFTLVSNEGSSCVSSGQTLSIQAIFSNPEKITKGENDLLSWTLTGQNGTAAPTGVTIDSNGILTVNRNVGEKTYAEVRAESPIFGTSAVFPVTIYPKAQQITLEPSEVFLYTGSDTPVVVKAVIHPEGAVTGKITWTPDKDGVLEVTETDDYTAEIKAREPCRTTVTVTESSGLHAKLPVSVINPVTAVTVSTGSKAYSGGKFYVTASFEPARPDNPAMEWSLNVGEEIATINRMGLVSVKKDVAPGTVITVTCTAFGAPVPVTGTIDIIVEK